MVEQPEDDGSELYNEMAEELPPREVEYSSGGEPQSLDEAEQYHPQLSDMQTADKGLFPDLGDDVINALMMARVSPEIFVDIIRLNVNAEIERMDETKEINIAKIATKWYTSGSIGLDGKGRIDRLELAGSSKEADAELEKLSKSMGI